MKFRLLTSAFAILAFCVPLAAQSVTESGAQNVKWQRLNSKSEFSIAMPAGSAGNTEDTEYFLGSNRSRVTKRIFVSNNIGGAVLIMEMLEGDVQGIKKELVSRLSSGTSPHELARSQNFDGVSVDFYYRKKDKVTSAQQFILFKKSLYIVQAHSLDENNPVLNQYLRSLSLAIGDKAVMPNLLPADDGKAALTPPDISVIPLAAISEVPLSEKPDRDAIVLYRPRPKFPSEARRAGATGAVVLRALLSASGKIAQIEVKSGDMALRDSGVAAAQGILFIPAEKDGKPVSVWKTISYSFSIY